MARVDEILDILDAGLQHSSELGFVADRKDMCARCNVTPSDKHSEFCEECRSWMRGET